MTDAKILPIAPKIKAKEAEEEKMGEGFKEYLEEVTAYQEKMRVKQEAARKAKNDLVKREYQLDKKKGKKK